MCFRDGPDGAGVAVGVLVSWKARVSPDLRVRAMKWVFLGCSLHRFSIYTVSVPTAILQGRCCQPPFL